MTNEQYTDRLSELADQLAAASNARPYDPDLYNAVIDEVQLLVDSYNRPPRFRLSILLMVFIFGSFFVLCVLFFLLFLLRR